MTRRGFALLAVLWVVIALTVLAGVAIAVVHTGAETTRNRLLLARAGWAREACVEILLARYAQDSSARGLDTVDLGRGTWCRAALDDLGARLNVNLADLPALRAILRVAVLDTLAADSLAQVILTRRRLAPFSDVAELGLLPGFDSGLVALLGAWLTTRGSGTIDVNAAPLPVLATLPGMTDEALRVLADRRGQARPLPSADAFDALLSEPARAALLGAFPDFVRAVTFRPVEFVGQIEGGVRGTAPRARATITVVPAAGRLAVIRRETE